MAYAMLSQLLVNALIAGSIYSLVGLGFALVFDQAKFFHFSHAAIFTAAPYGAYFFIQHTDFHIVISYVLGVVLAITLGLIIERSIYRLLRNREASGVIILLASLGMYVVVENVISILFGDHTITIRNSQVQEGIDIFGAKITNIQVTMVGTNIIAVAGLLLMLHKTKIGHAMRAVASDPWLALVSGIDQNRVLLITLFVASLLAGVAGILFALDVDMIPTMGMPVLMMAVVAAIAGGTSSVVGVMLGGFFLALTQQVGTILFGVEWQDTIAFVILLGFLLIRPQGFFGKHIRKVTV